MTGSNKTASTGFSLKPLAAYLCASMVVGGASSASFAEGFALEEIIVTAQKRAESLQDVPVAIQAVSGEDLASAGVASIDALEQLAPGLTVNDMGGWALISVRGVGSTNQGYGSYTSVSMYVDDVYVSRAQSGMFGLNSVSQVQVLRGPQGALYGRNATGGAVVIETKTPHPGGEFEGRVSGSLGNHDNRSYSLSLSGGLTDNIAASFEFSGNKREGFVESTTPGTDDLEGRDDYTVLGKLVVTPSDETEVVLNLWYDEVDDNRGTGLQQVNADTINSAHLLNQFFQSQGLQQLNNPGLFTFTVAAGGACGLTSPAGFCTPAQFQSFLTNPAVAGINGAVAAADYVTAFGKAGNNSVGGHLQGTLPSSDNDSHRGALFDTDNLRTSLKVTHAFDTFDLVSITAYQESDVENALDIVGLESGSLLLPGTDNIGFSGVSDSEGYSQEIRLVSTESEFDWLVGVYYFHDEGNTKINGDFFGASLRQADNFFEVDSYSVYGQIKYPLTDTVNVTFGVRWTDEDYQLTDNFDSAIADPNTPVVPGIVSVQTVNAVAPGTFDTEVNFSQITGSLIVDWSIGEASMVYAGVNTGFKSGGLNATNPLSGGVDAEEITAYEMGFKSEMLDGRVRLNGSVFLYDYENIHIQAVNASTGATILLNGSNADIQGAELEVLALLSEGLTFNASLSLLDSEYKDDVLIPGIPGVPGSETAMGIAGNSLVGAPERSFSIGLEKVIDLADGELSINGNAQFNGGYFYDPENLIGTGGDDDDAYTTVNASVTYRQDDWDLALWVNNLTDEEYFTSGLVTNSLSEMGVAAAPRMYGLTFGYNF
jgi:outer membrane receptor protein involved in Fe transport